MRSSRRSASTLGNSKCPRSAGRQMGVDGMSIKVRADKYSGSMAVAMASGGGRMLNAALGVTRAQQEDRRLPHAGGPGLVAAGAA
ncbi:MAG: hypothetical protein V3V49_01420 [Candidatus Krumholzibacteria bacterium]